MKVKILFSALLLTVMVQLNAQNEAYTNVNNNFSTSQSITGSINPLYAPLQLNHNLLTESDLLAGLAYHSVGTGYSNYPTATGHAWSFKNSASRTHQLFFKKNSTDFWINAWDVSTNAWAGWTKVLTEFNFDTTIGTNYHKSTTHLSMAQDRGILLNGTSSAMAINYDITDGSSTVINRFKNNGATSMDLVFYPSATTPYLEYRQAGSTSDYFRIFQDGSINSSGNATFSKNISVNRTTNNDVPLELQSKGSGAAYSIFYNNDGTERLMDFVHSTGNTGYVRMYNAGTVSNYFNTNGDSYFSNNLALGATSAQGNKLYVDGTSEFSGKMTVDNDIIAKKLRVTVNPTAVPDYVFQPGYDLKTLAEVEAYIKANFHLPGIASASEIGANGQDVGAMQLNLLEKIEELTLYTIEQEKAIKTSDNRLQTLDMENKELKTENKKLKSKTQMLENTLEELLKRVEKLENKGNTSNDQ